MTSFLRLAALALCAAAAASVHAAGTVLNIDFEDEALGPLGSPWSVDPPAGGAEVSIVDAGKHGHVLLLDGEAAEGAWVVANLGFDASPRRVEASFEVNTSAGSAFVWSLNGAGQSLGARRVRLQVAPGTDTLVAQTSPSGSTSCGPLRTNHWSHVALNVDARRDPHTFSVTIDGRDTACMNVETGLGAPFDGVSIMDASNAGWGGAVRFDDLVVKTR